MEWVPEAHPAMAPIIGSKSGTRVLNRASNAIWPIWAVGQQFCTCTCRVSIKFSHFCSSTMVSVTIKQLLRAAYIVSEDRLVTATNRVMRQD